MSIHYHAVKLDHAEMFDLGQTNFTRVLSFEPMILRNRYDTVSDLADRIECAIDDGNWDKEVLLNAWIYSHRIAQKMWDWCGWDRIIVLGEEDLPHWFEHDITAGKYNAKHRNFADYLETGSIYPFDERSTNGK